MEKKNEKTKKKPMDDKKFERVMRKIEISIGFMGIIVNIVIAIFVGTATNNIGNITDNKGTINSAETINNNYGEKVPTSQMLQNALNYYKNEQYEEAFKEYVKCIKDDSAIAHLNIGYLYSHGLGCDFDFGQAQFHYKEAIRLGMKEKGFENYMALNLAKPDSLENTIEALKYGYYSENEDTIRYLSYLQTGTMYANFEGNCKENARIFMEKIENNQDLNLEEKLVIGSVEIKEIDRNYTPTDTMFKKYSKYTKVWREGEATTTSMLGKENGEYKEILLNVADIGETDYYIVSNYKFIFSDTIFSEEFYEFINI